MNLVLTAILIGNLQVTAYRSTPNQTDSSPWLTSIGERVTVRGLAVSPDLLKKNGGPLDYGDLVYVEGTGYRFVNDVMHPRHKRAIDMWVPTYQEEKKFDEKYKGKKLKVYLVKEIKNK